MTTSISVIVIDDEELVAAAIAELCASMHGVTVVGFACSGWNGFALIEKVKPDVALVDLTMTDLSGVDLSAHLAQKKIRTNVITLTGSPDEELCSRARQLGVRGYLMKTCSPNELEIAIRAAARGKMYVTPLMMEAFWRQSVHTTAMPLSLRQREVLQLIVHDKSNKEIAGVLGIEVKTVEKHRAELRRRFGVTGTGGLVAFAVRNRLVYV